ncbi:hypothetical protein RJ639_034612 [Escallonia herrerae]|uniref:CDP-diacylglycerol-glycerol-3-phosphate 3-phosphatidyltransferase n=1 Tax=Escallonia herrerae TaxID=1293975 RepID=A0AA88WX00_9ASTE|nr:hypothetical protein RJ639_034612 [Escallonia herrerae]
MAETNSSSYETSWADQWDSNPDPAPETKKSGNGTTSKYGKKVGEGFEKTKAVASTGARKVKEGTFAGLQWIKDKYHKTTQKR